MGVFQGSKAGVINEEEYSDCLQPKNIGSTRV